MFARSKTMASLTGCLMVGSCMAAGDFCDVVRAPLTFHPTTAAAIVRTDRDVAERIETQNVYGEKTCEW